VLNAPTGEPLARAVVTTNGYRHLEYPKWCDKGFDDSIGQFQPLAGLPHAELDRRERLIVGVGMC